MEFASERWDLWSTTAQVTVTDPARLGSAVALARGILSEIDEACSRFRADSELQQLRGHLAAGSEVSPRLASLVRAAIDAAAWTDGAVDPTLGGDLASLGYDRDIDVIRAAGASSEPTISIATIAQRSPGWRRIGLDGLVLTVPDDIVLDLGASAKALAADECARAISSAYGCGALVSLGGDIATAGVDPVGGWQVLVQDVPGDPEQVVTIEAGFAVATSSTQKRRWKVGSEVHHHILDPRYGVPVEAVWRSVTVAAQTCLYANTLSTASIVRGPSAPEWLRSLGAAARLVDREGQVTAVGGWPVEAATTAVER